MKKYLLVLLLSFSCFYALAHNNEDDDEAKKGTVTGTVLTSDGKAAVGVSIHISGTDKYTIADGSGHFGFKLLPGTYTLEASFVGYETTTATVTVQEKETVEVQMQLSVTKSQLKDVIVNASNSSYKINNASSTLRLDIPIIEVPQNIQEISSVALQDQQVTSMADGVIRNVSGATKLEHWSNYTRINMRGSRASEFRNGMNVTSNWGPVTADMSVVDRVEFVKGPAGFMMSNGEPSGIFNIVTKKPTGITKGEATIMFGSYDFYRAAMDLDGHLDKDNKLQYRLNVMGQSANSFQKYAFNDRVSIAPVLKYLVDDKTDITVEYLYQYNKSNDGGAPYIYSPNGYGDLPRDFTTEMPGLEPLEVKDQSLFLYLHHQINPDWKLTVQGAYMHATKVGTDLWPTSLDADGNMIRGIGTADALNNAKFGQVFLNGKAQTGSVRHRILGGIDLGDKDNYYDWGQSFEFDTPENPFNIYHPDYGIPANGLPAFDRSKGIKERAAINQTILSQSYSGIYLQDELGFFDNTLRLTLAGRYTYVKQSDYGSTYSAKKVTPRVGLSYSINHSFSVYGLFDQSFLPQQGILRGDISPKPQTGNNLEFGVKKDWFGGRWNTTVSAYRILKKGQLVADPDPSGGNENGKYSLQLGEAETKGVEVDIKGEILPGLNAVMNYAYTDAKVTEDIDPANIGKALSGFAKHVANGWLSYRLGDGVLKGFGISGGFTFMGNRSTWGWAAENQMDLPDYFRMDGGLSWKGKKLGVNLNVFNLLDKYLYSGAPYGTFYYYQVEAPRNFKLSFTYKF